MTITHLNNKAIAVTGLPEGAYISGIQGRELYYWSSYGGYDIGDYPKSIHLPEGNWRILGFAQDLTQVQKAEYEPLLEAKGLHVENDPKPDIEDYLTGRQYQHFLNIWQSANEFTNPLILIK